MSYLTRVKALIQVVKRHDAPVPSNAALVEFGQAVLYHPTSRPIWGSILDEHEWIINPANPNQFDDVGILSDDEEKVFIPATTQSINDAISSLFLRKIRREMTHWLRAYRIHTVAPTGSTLEASRSDILATAESDALTIVGDDADDPDN